MRALTLGGTTDRVISDAVPPVADMVGGDRSAADFDALNDSLWDMKTKTAALSFSDGRNDLIPSAGLASRRANSDTSETRIFSQHVLS